MLFEALGKVDASVGGRFDEVNTAARRLWFESQDTISWALIQTETAVNTLVELGKIECGKPLATAVCWLMTGVFQVSRLR
jgi:hypothetical protein